MKNLSEIIELTRAALAPVWTLSPAAVVASYKFFTRPKHDGTLRQIAEPTGALREAQDWLTANLWPELLHVSPAAHGHVAERSILTHAQVHAPCHTLLTCDIKDYFGSVRDSASLDVLIGLPEDLRERIVSLCWDPLGHGIPQGAPTSPALANACFILADAFLGALATTLDARYSRYVDDLAFSWPNAPVMTTDGLHPVAGVLNGVQILLGVNGYQLNKTKTRLAGPNDQQLVTGLIVTPAPGRPAVRAPRARWRMLRAAVHNAIRDAERGRPQTEEAIKHLQGLCSFLRLTDPERVRKYEYVVSRLAHFSASRPEYR